MASVPARRQLPAILGRTVGIDESAASAVENVTLIGAAPLTPTVPAAGVTDMTLSGTLALLASLAALPWWPAEPPAVD